MKEIPLTQGKVALVDDEDYDSLIGFYWQAKRTRNGKVWYASRTGRADSGTRTTGILMHRQILGLTDRKQQVDHENGNGLDNQKDNLRVATCSQNHFNRERYSNNLSGYKGVYIRPKRCHRPWHARIQVNKKNIHIGYFHTAKEAALAYDEAAREHHGEFARTNF